jgi:hypothetical protein
MQDLKINNWVTVCYKVSRGENNHAILKEGKRIQSGSSTTRLSDINKHLKTIKELRTMQPF